MTEKMKEMQWKCPMVSEVKPGKNGMTLTERLRARFAGRIPKTLAPGKGLLMVDRVHTWRSRKECWEAARALEQEFAQEVTGRGMGVELVQVDVRPVCFCFGKRLLVEFRVM